MIGVAFDREAVPSHRDALSLTKLTEQAGPFRREDPASNQALLIERTIEVIAEIFHVMRLSRGN